jgi:hypothetical protein
MSILTPKKDNHTYILIYGNPVDGMKFEGPFETFEDAEDYTINSWEDWWIAELKTPEPKPDFTLRDRDG